MGNERCWDVDVQGVDTAHAVPEPVRAEPPPEKMTILSIFAKWATGYMAL
jgi:hypothetical protein